MDTRLLLLLCLVACTPRATDTATDSPPADDPWIELFNHRDLSGWYMDVPTKPNVKLRAPFLVRDGNLVSLGEPRGHLLTDSTYADYELYVRYRFAGEPGNCGVLVHASEPRMLYDMFPRSIEVQMEHTNAGDFWVIGEDIEVPDMEARRGPREKWGRTEGTNRNIKHLQDGVENPLGEWNEMTIRCKADRITVHVNGVLQNVGTNCTVRSGQIALQAEGAEVEFSDLRLRSLSE